MILFVDVLVHDWLCEHWIVTFIVAVATVANLKLFVRGQLDHEKEVGIYDKYTQAYLPFLQNCLNFLDPFTPKISPVAFLTVCHKFCCISCKVFQTAATPCVSAGLYSCGRRFERWSISHWKRFMPPKFFAICLNLYITRGRSHISHLSHTTWLTNRNLYDPCSSNAVTVLLVRQSSFYFALILYRNSKSVFKRELQTEIIIYLKCKTYQINDNIFAKLSSPFCCNFTHMHHSLWVIGIHMENRSIYNLKNKIFRWRS